MPQALRKYFNTFLRARSAQHMSLSYCQSKAIRENVIKIGNVSKEVTIPKSPELVPLQYLPKHPSQSVLHHLQWIMKKDILGQDMFLIGLPGPFRSRVILQYLEMMQCEVEYVVLSRDTTENDLKQRREIQNGTAHYVDQSAVRAAMNGRFLILDGVEKVERNVLPVLNNLLENREMQLEDGRFLIAPERYDKLLLTHSQEELDEWKLVRVSENFRVVALGLPVPHFKGNPLDPPFRSRFQARNVQSSFEEQVSEFSADSAKLKNFLAACYTFVSNESSTLGLPKFPIENISSVIKVLKSFPDLPTSHAFKWLYPYTLILPQDSQQALLKTLKQFSMHPQNIKIEYGISKLKALHDSNNTHIFECTIANRKKKHVEIMGNENHEISTEYVPNVYHEDVLSDMLLTHTSHDFCIIGYKGSGKATLVKKFASLLNYSTEIVMLYNDMTARDLLQQRITDEKGNTLWRFSQIVQAAAKGKLLVLDGLHRLHSSTFSVLQRLIHNREMQLYDGTRLLSHNRYDSIKASLGLSDQEMQDKKLMRIHPAFRIVALAEPFKLQSSKDNWMTPELLSMFLFHAIRPLSLQEEKLVIQKIVKKMSKKMSTILDFTHTLRNSDDDALRNVGSSFSTRQLVRIAQRLSAYPMENVYSLISQSCLMPFLPQLTKQSVETVLSGLGIQKQQKDLTQKKISTTEGTLCIGTTKATISSPGSSEVKVPDILFYENEEHICIMEDMLQEFLLGEHLLLVGNQGVGKNKITDRFLQLLNRPREYIQLHRDTTVQSLTQQPTVVDGKIVYEDSPLLRAVQHGRVLVVDEADKAPTHVTSILKALVVSGEMALSDGRCIVHHTDVKARENTPVVVMHPDFRMIVLANRPGFPFLGNDFFATLGDIFSCHAVDNPSYDSELSMLRQYGPTVPDYLLQKLANVFGELRSMSDAGLISYPYSTREVVNVTKHMEKFPSEGVPFVLKNVFDFDLFSSEMKKTIDEIFRKHGLPIENATISVKVSKKFKLPEPTLTAQWEVDDKNITLVPKIQNLNLGNGDSLRVQDDKLNMVEMRSSVFTEERDYIQLPLNHNNIPLDVVAKNTNDKNLIYVATANPVYLYIADIHQMLLKCIDLSRYFPTVRSGFRPSVQMSVIELENNDLVALHESCTNQTFLINPVSGLLNKINVQSLFEETFLKISSAMSTKPSSQTFELCGGFPSATKMIIFNKNDVKLALINFETKLIMHVNSPEPIVNLHILDENTLLVIGNTNVFVINICDPEKWETQKVKCNGENSGSDFAIKKINMEDIKLQGNHISPQKEIAMMSNSVSYVDILSGTFTRDKILQILSFPREIALENGKVCMFPHQLVRFVKSSDLPNFAKSDSTDINPGFLEVVNLKNSSFGYIEISLPHSISSFASWLAGTSDPYLLLCATSNGKLITSDARGCIRRFEIDSDSLESSFHEWKRIAGLNDQQQLTIEKVNSNPVTAPKHGRVDPTGSPHVGGNTWAGGTGGRDTAGLGGKGGPYRLDAGHNVFQVSDQEKDAVPPEVKKAAREMAMRAYKEKLKEIEMSEYDDSLYNQFFSSVEKQVKSLRVILDGLQAKSKERKWMHHQTSGEFDDVKLIEGITGEKSIYKRRGDQEPEMGAPQEKPKLLRLVVDVSGSMYRFNGHDNRLQREIESIILVMEAFEGYQEKFKYEILGHSGEDYKLPFSKFDSPPKNKKDRLDLLRNMHAHSQFCTSGDNTLEATEHAIKTITKEEADEYFVIVLSDANFDRYGISPASFGKLLVSNPKVNAFAIFIGSLGNQADVVSKYLPVGRGFVCFDSSHLTPILQKIFTSALLRD